jgi:hypothetical protein
LGEALSVRDLIGWVVARGGPEFGENLGNIDRDRFARAPHGMLVNHMARNREKIGFGAADTLVALDAQ